jgi:hypothetical protein
MNSIGHYLADIISESKKYIDADDTMVLASALSMMSVVLGNRVHTFDGTMGRLYPNVWTLIVAQSGTGSKSVTIKTLNNMILKSILNYNQETYKKDQDSYKPLSKDGQCPQLKQIISGQGSTFQGIIKSLEKNPHGMIAIYDEAKELLNKLKRNAEHKAGLTSLYDQEYYGKDLVGSKNEGESIYLENPFLSILAVTNPHWLSEETIDSDYASGFLNRFTIIEIDKFPRQKAFKIIEEQDFSKFQDTSLKLWRELESPDVQQNPIVLNIESDTAKIYSNWFDMQLESYENAESHSQSFLIRQLVSALKYATIIQTYDAVYKGEALKKMNKLEPKYLSIGIYLAELFMNHIEKHIENLSENYNSMTSKLMISIDDLADKLINYLTREEHIGQFFNKSQLVNYNRGITAENFYDAFDLARKKDDRLRVFVYKQGKKDVEQYYAEKPRIANESDEIEI